MSIFHPCLVREVEALDALLKAVARREFDMVAAGPSIGWGGR